MHIRGRLIASVSIRCAFARPDFKDDVLVLVESTVIEFAVLFHLPEILGRDSPTVSFVIDDNRLPGNP